MEKVLEPAEDVELIKQLLGEEDYIFAEDVLERYIPK